jgi:hypothetical protein
MKKKPQKINPDTIRLDWLEAGNMLYHTKYRKAWGAYSINDQHYLKPGNFAPTIRGAIDNAMRQDAELATSHPPECCSCCRCRGVKP